MGKLLQNFYFFIFLPLHSPDSNVFDLFLDYVFSECIYVVEVELKQ